MRIRPLIYLSPDEPAAGGEVEAEPATPAEVAEVEAVVEAEPVAPVEEKGPQPWEKSLETRFEDPDTRALVHAYMLEEHAPYVTRVEQERKDALDRAWIFDNLDNEETRVETLKEIAEQIWGEEKAAAIVALVAEGETVEDAEAIVEEQTEDEIDLAKLPKAVREAVEFATAERARQAQAAADDAQAAANEQYDAWVADTLKANADIAEMDLHAYVHANGGDLDAALTNYRKAHPAPEAPKPTPPATIHGSSQLGVEPPSRHSSLGDAMGAVWDAAQHA